MFDNCHQEMKLGRDVLKLVLERLSLKEGEGVVPFIEPKMEGLTHAKARPHKLDPQISVRCCDPNHFPMNVEM